MTTSSPWTTSFFDLQQPQVLLLVTLRHLSKVSDLLEVLYAATKAIMHQVLDMNLDLDNSMCVYESKH